MSAIPSTAKPRSSRRQLATSGMFWNWAPLCLLLTGSLLVTAFVTLRPHDPQRLAAIFPPWWTAEQSLTAASHVAGVSGFGAFPFIVAVRGTQPGLERELREAGAIAVIDGALFTYCGTPRKGV